jgi:trimethylamine:corrinoid methyltransferase-like protein
MREVWQPRLFDRSAYDVWQRDGRRGARERAADLASDLCGGHEVPPLDAEKRATLRRIIATAGL